MFVCLIVSPYVYGGDFVKNNDTNNSDTIDYFRSSIPIEWPQDFNYADKKLCQYIIKNWNEISDFTEYTNQFKSKTLQSYFVMLSSFEMFKRNGCKEFFYRYLSNRSKAPIGVAIIAANIFAKIKPNEFRGFVKKNREKLTKYCCLLHDFLSMCDDEISMDVFIKNCEKSGEKEAHSIFLLMKYDSATREKFEKAVERAVELSKSKNYFAAVNSLNFSPSCYLLPDNIQYEYYDWFQ